MTNDIQLWIWLQLALGCGNQNVRQICELFGDVENFYIAGKKAWYDCHLFSRQEFDRLCAIKPADTIDIINSCNRLGYRMVTPRDEEYPERLLNITDYPAVLYICGQPIYFDKEVSIATVGMRECTENGKRLARSIGYNLTKSGALVVSGGARGIDAACHEGALQAKGITVAFLACGINTRYLIQNEPLRNTIARNGALISEYPPGTPVYHRNFHVRNRLMSGVSLGTVVIEADYKSGSLITSTHATNQGRDVFAVPGSVMSRTSKGTNKLIADGAKPITTAADILEEYVDMFPHKIVLNATDNNQPTPPPMRRYESERQREWKNRHDPVNAPSPGFVPANNSAEYHEPVNAQYVDYIPASSPSEHYNTTWQSYNNTAYAYPHNPAYAAINDPGPSYEAVKTTADRSTMSNDPSYIKKTNNPSVSKPAVNDPAIDAKANKTSVIPEKENEDIAPGEALERLYVSTLNTYMENTSWIDDSLAHRVEMRKRPNINGLSDYIVPKTQRKERISSADRKSVKREANSFEVDEIAKHEQEQKEQTHKDLTKNIAEGIDDGYLEIIEVLGDETLHIDEISSRTGKPTKELALTLTEMEIEGLIKSKPGRRFCKA